MDSTPHRRSEAAVLLRRLRAEATRLRLRILGNALLALLATGGVILLAAVLSVESWPAVGPLAAWAVWAVLAFAVIWIAVAEIAVPLRHCWSLSAFSRQLEHHEKLDNLLVAATQFSRQEGRPSGEVSAELVMETLHRARRRVESSPLSSRIPLAGAVSHLGLALAILSAWLLLGLLAPARIDATWSALRHPSLLHRTAPSSGLYTLDGDLSVPSGETATLRARDLIGGEPPVVLEISWTGDWWQPVETELRTPDPSDRPFLVWEGKVLQATDPFHYRFRKGNLFTRVHRVDIRERPVIRSVQARILPPSYTHRPAGDWSELAGSVEVLAGSRLLLRGEASAPLQKARRVVQGGEAVDLTVDGNAFADTLRVQHDLDFSFELTDRTGSPSEAATVYHLQAVPDDVPTVRITHPEPELDLGRDLKVRVEGLAMDDVGLRRVELLYRLPADSRWRSIPLIENERSVVANDSIEDLQVDAGHRELALAFTWKLGEIELFPGDALSYRLQAVDTFPKGGGQKGQSAIHSLRLPTIAQVLTEQTESSTTQRDALGEMLRQGEELHEELENLRRKLMKNPRPDWSTKQEIEELLKNQEELRRQAKEASERMQSMLDDYERNNSGGIELLQKMETVQELLESLQEESVKSYLDAMDKAMDQLSSEDLRRAMEEATKGQEEMNRRLDRTISLLRQLQREKEMSDLIEEVKEYLSRQQDLQSQLEENLAERTPAGESPPEDSTSSSSESAADSLASRSAADSTGHKLQGESSREGGAQMSEEELARLQEQLAEQTEALEKRLRERLEELKKQMESGEADGPSAQQMRQALEEALRQMQSGGSSSGSMSKAREEMTEGQREQARKSMEQAMKQLISLYQVLAKGQKGMTQANMQVAVEKLQKTAYDLLQISFEEEKVVRALDGGVDDQRLSPLTRRQFHLTRSTRRLSDELEELAAKNFFVGEKLLKNLRDLVEAMETTVRQMEYSRPKRARVDAETSMGMMNRVVIGLLTTAQQQGQGSGGGSASQQMQQMVDGQSRLNAMTEELRRRARAGLSGEERRQLAQLKAMQEQIRRQLEEFRRTLQDERKVLGDLGKLEQDMQREERLLEKGRLEGEARDLQDHILSRLLDAERSVRERDFARRRESKTGKELFGRQSGELGPGDASASEQQLRRWRAPDRAPREYQDEVRRYFRRIQEELQEGKAP